MNIYAYYEDVGQKEQEELLKLWKISWQRNGWNPVVLGIQDAKQSSLHDVYMQFVIDVHKEIGTDIKCGYCWAAQREIVAFHRIQKPSFISDYDVINIGQEPLEAEGKVHWRDGDCTCFASGDSKGWEAYIHWLFKNESNIIKGLKKIHKETKRKSFHDQDFLAVARKSCDSELPFEAYRNTNSPKGNLDKENKLLHISHALVNKIAKERAITSTPQLRVQLVKEALGL